MARVVFLTNNICESTEQWRVKIRAISDALQASGLRKTADTGQIDIDAIEWDSAAANNFGFEIYEFQDSLSGDAPLFVKISYRSRSWSNSSTGRVNPLGFLMRLSVGKGSDGEGNLTEPMGSSFDTTSPTFTDTYASLANQRAILTSFVCHTDGYLAISIGPDAGRSTYMNLNAHGGPSIIVCRTVDDNGLPNSEGVVLYIKTNESGSSISNSQMLGYFYNYESSAVTYNGGVGYCTVFGSINQNSLGHVEVHKHYRSTPVRAVNPYVLTYPTAHIPPYHTFEAFVGGRTRTYLTMPFYPFGSAESSSTSNASAAAILWE